MDRRGLNAQYYMWWGKGKGDIKEAMDLDSNNTGIIGTRPLALLPYLGALLWRPVFHLVVGISRIDGLDTCDCE